MHSENGKTQKNILKSKLGYATIEKVMSRNNCRRFEKSGSIKDSINGNIYID